jgi:hypothetical protein
VHERDNKIRHEKLLPNDVGKFELSTILIQSCMSQSGLLLYPINQSTSLVFGAGKGAMMPILRNFVRGVFHTLTAFIYFVTLTIYIRLSTSISASLAVFQ